MFTDLFAKKRIKINAPLSGKVVPVTEVADPVFKYGLLGKGIAIIPDGGRVVSPVSGTVTQMFNTGHAVSLTSDEGVEVLIHIGLDTIKLQGKHYRARAKTGDRVSEGDILMEFDKDAITADGYDTVTPVVICNSEDFKSVCLDAGEKVNELDSLLVMKA